VYATAPSRLCLNGSGNMSRNIFPSLPVWLWPPIGKVSDRNMQRPRIQCGNRLWRIAIFYSSKVIIDLAAQV
jgi:hypothetical protein